MTSTHLFRTAATLASAIAAVLFVSTAPVLADHLENCREIDDDRAASLQDRTALVTDIDGVLTEYVNLDYGPTNGAFLDKGVAYARTDAALMINIYHRRGYLVVYMAGRPRNMEIVGKTACQATLDWLYGNGFPIDPANTLLLLRDLPDSVVDAKDPGLAMANWMGDNGTQAFHEMIEAVKDHYAIVPTYGYVDSDVVTQAFIDSGVPADHIFSIGNKGMSRLGFMGSNAIVGRETNPGYNDHVKTFVIPDVKDLDP
jgi:hypothetical protein